MGSLSARHYSYRADNGPMSINLSRNLAAMLAVQDVVFFCFFFFCFFFFLLLLLLFFGVGNRCVVAVCCYFVIL